MCGMQHSKVMNILHVELSQVTGASASAVSELLTTNYKAHIFFFGWWGWVGVEVGGEVGGGVGEEVGEFNVIAW